MTWVKYTKRGLINLDRITEIRVKKIHDTENSYVWIIHLYDGRDNYLLERYTSFEECMRAFEYLVKCLESGKQYIDITSFS